MRILKEDGSEAKANELGRVVCKLPLPPGTLSTLYKAPERFLSAYFKAYPGYYDTCDAGTYIFEIVFYACSRCIYLKDLPRLYYLF